MTEQEPVWSQLMKLAYGPHGVPQPDSDDKVLEFIEQHPDADLNWAPMERGWGWGPLSYYCHDLNKRMVAILLKHRGVDPNGDEREGGNYPLTNAIFMGGHLRNPQKRADALAIIKMLVEAGADPWKMTTDTHYPHCAMSLVGWMRDQEMLEVILAHTPGLVIPASRDSELEVALSDRRYEDYRWGRPVTFRGASVRVPSISNKKRNKILSLINRFVADPVAERRKLQHKLEGELARL